MVGVVINYIVLLINHTHILIATYFFPTNLTLSTLLIINSSLKHTIDCYPTTYINYGIII